MYGTHDNWAISKNNKYILKLATISVMHEHMKGSASL